MLVLLVSNYPSIHLSVHVTVLQMSRISQQHARQEGKGLEGGTLKQRREHERELAKVDARSRGVDNASSSAGGPPAKRSKQDTEGLKGDPSSEEAKPLSVAEKIMLKSGFKPGQGIGAQGQGRVEPILPKPREGYSGIGVVQMSQLDSEGASVPDAPLFLDNDDVSMPLQFPMSVLLPADHALVYGRVIEAVRVTRFARAKLLRKLSAARADKLPLVYTRVAAEASKGKGFSLQLLRACPSLLLWSNDEGFGDLDHVLTLLKPLHFPDCQEITLILPSQDAKKVTCVPNTCSLPVCETMATCAEAASTFLSQHAASTVTAVHVPCGLACTASPTRAMEHKCAATTFRQVVLALHVMAEDGTLVVQMGDGFSRMSACIVFLLRLCFKSVFFTKPLVSLACSPARYLVCSAKSERCEAVVQQLTAVQQQDEHQHSLLSVIGMQYLLDRTFLQHYVNTVERFAIRELMTLARLSDALKHCDEEEQGQGEASIVDLAKLKEAEKEMTSQDPNVRFSVDDSDPTMQLIAFAQAAGAFN